MNTSKAQINQVFVWIIVALVIGAVALVGVRSIGGLLEDKCSIDLIRFQDKLEESIRLNNDFGSVNLETLTAPCDYTKICLVDARAIQRGIPPDLSSQDSDLSPFFSVISSSVDDQVQENVFLFNQKELIPAGYISQVRLDKGKDDAESLPPYVLCFESKAGRFTLKLEGLGKNTLVSTQEP
ncbi:MAG: hypothetical protein KC535_00520 [Nanoarchaeota archaeon]|nr:hypothetical protein [Nanoarchaeota archaeon]